MLFRSSGKKFLNHGIGNTILGGWQLNGIAVFHSGFPLEMTTAVNNLFNYGGTQRPNWTGQDPNTNGSMSSRINQYFNPAVFSQPAPYTFCNVGRQLAILRSPGLANLDLSVFKNFPIHERLKLQFRAEAFNLMNHPQFAPPNTGIGTPSAGVISAVNNAPRNIQLALKLLF